jgi:hypothetical protein
MSSEAVRAIAHGNGSRRQGSQRRFAGVTGVMNHNKFIREVVARIVGLVRAETSLSNPTPDDIDLGKLMTQIQNEFPALTGQGLVRVFSIAHDQIMAEDSPDTMSGVLKMLDGLPEGTTIGEAVEIKAARGEPLARQLLAERQSARSRFRRT